MNYKMIVVDLDDSLLGKDLKISPANKKALLSAVDKGLMVTFATGRMFRSTLPFIRDLSLNVPVITYQGALIKNALTEETLLKIPLSLFYAHQIIQICKEEELYLQIYDEDDYYFSKDNQYSQLYHELSGIQGKAVGDLKLFLTQEPTKMLIIDDPDKIQSLNKRFKTLFGDEIQVAVSKPFYLEITHMDANKGKAVEHLATMYGISRDEIVAIGDSYNDISMLTYAGMGIAMGNSPDAVKEIADAVTSGHDEDGVAKALHDYVLGGGDTL